MINDLKFYNYELKEQVRILEKMNEMKNGVYKKYDEYRKKYETLKEKWDKKYEEVYLILDGKNDNIIFELKTYLKNILKEKYDELVHNIKNVGKEVDDNNKTIILLNKNKGYGGENDIDILIHNWLENKQKDEIKIIENNNEDDIALWEKWE